ILSDTAMITLNKKATTMSALKGQYEVAQLSMTGERPKKISQMDLLDIPSKLSAEDARSFLLGAIMVEFAVILLIVPNAAASTVTREKEDGTLDLLLSTPITSRYYIWGKLRGLVSFVIPLIAVPVLSVFVFIFYDTFHLIRNLHESDFKWIVLPDG